MWQVIQRLRELGQLKAAEYSIYLSAAAASSENASGAANHGSTLVENPADDLGAMLMNVQRPCLLTVMQNAYRIM
jgi:hypothetical protein